MQRSTFGADCGTALLRSGVAALALLIVCGCASTTRIEARDHRVVQPSLRASVSFAKGIESPSDPHAGHAIEFGGFRGNGDDSQSLGATQSPIILGGKSFAGPVQLTHDFRFSYADVGWRWRKFFGDGSFGIEVLAGMGYAELDLATSSPTQQASQGFHTRGAQGGFGIVWRVQPGTSVQARATEFASLRDGIGRAFRTEVVFAQALGRYVTARIGYAGWEVEGQALANSSDFRLRFSGPALGLQFDFGP
jgi:hypothetical protein